MGVESFVTGVVHLDTPAAAALRGMPVWDWFSESAAADGPLTLELGERWYRNIGRCLTTDLARAQEHGDVFGKVLVHCQDGGHAWEAASYRGRECWQGEAECFEEPVVLRRRRPTALRLGGGSGDLLAELDGFWFFLDDARAGEAFELEQPAAPMACSCGGWNWRTDRAVCANSTLHRGQWLATTRGAASRDGEASG